MCICGSLDKIEYYLYSYNEMDVVVYVLVLKKYLIFIRFSGNFEGLREFMF